MTYFTDSVFERMMMQKPKYGREKQSPAHKNTSPQKADKQKPYRELIITPKERKAEQ